MRMCIVHVFMFVQQFINAILFDKFQCFKKHFGIATFRSYTKTMILQYPSKLHILQILDHCARLAWSFLASLNRKVMIWWGFFMLTAPAAVSAHVGIDSLKKPHDIISLSFCEVIKDHATCLPQGNR